MAQRFFSVDELLDQIDNLLRQHQTEGMIDSFMLIMVKDDSEDDADTITVKNTYSGSPFNLSLGIHSFFTSDKHGSCIKKAVKFLEQSDCITPAIPNE